MKKLFTIILAACGVVAAYGYDYHVQTEPTTRKVLLEEFTGIHCGNCPDGHKYASRLLLAKPDDVYVMCIHGGYFAIPAFDEPDFRTDIGEEIITEFGVTSYPSGMINRYNFGEIGTVISRSNWTASSRTMTRTSAPVNLWVNADYDKDTRMLDITVEGYFTESVATAEDGSAPTLYIALTQDYIQGPQSGGLVGDEYVHKHMFRDFVTEGTWGEALESANAGEYFVKNYSYELPEAYKDVEVVPTDLEVIAYVTMGKRDVLNVIGCQPSCEGMTAIYDPEIALEKIPASRGYFFNYIDLYVDNRSTEPITDAIFEVTSNGEVYTLSWQGEIPARTINWPIRIEVPAASGEETNTMKVKMIQANGSDVSTSTLTMSYAEIPEVPTELKVKLRTDNFADDNNYLLRDENGEVIREFGPYPDGVAEVYEEDVTLEPGKKYCFEVADAWGDGVLSPRGNFKIYDADDQLVTQQLEISQFGIRIFVQAADDSAVRNILSEESHEVARYALDGTLLDAPAAGINIVVMSDGSVIKQIVK
ncbi:MAG: Omp28-related outer membrane protein [Lepagella sp.]